LRLLGKGDRHNIRHEQMGEPDGNRKDGCRQAEDGPRSSHHALLGKVVAVRDSMTRRPMPPIDVDQARRDARAELLLSSNAAK
jgi:hypothetical protein